MNPLKALLLAALLPLLVTLAQGSLTGDSLTLRGFSYIKLNSQDATQQTTVRGSDGTKTGFGAMPVYDVPFRYGSDGSSALLGHVRGIGSFTNADNPLDNASLFLTFEIKHANSNCSIIVHGTSERTDTVKPFAIVGGSGPFSLARGKALQQKARQATDSAGATLIVNEWKFTFFQEKDGDSIVGMDLQKLQKLFPDLVSEA